VSWHFAAGVLALAACAAPAQAGADFESGRQQYQRSCAQCHGRNLVNSGVTVYDLRKFPLDQRERFFQSLHHGKGNMPAFRDALDDGQMRSLWVYVRNRGEPPPPLTVCAADGNAPLSHRQNGEPRGLDVEVAKAIAAEVGTTARWLFYESEYDRDRTLAQEVNALLSSGACALASGYALFASDLGAPGRPMARTPDYEGAKPRRQRPFILLQNLAATRPYYAMAMGVITRDAAMKVESLADLQNVKVGAVSGTMAGSALMLYRNGLLQSSLVTLNQRENALEALEAGRFEATLASLATYDAYRLRNPATRLVRAAYVHPLRVNLGFVGLENEKDLLAAANQVISRTIADGQLERWAQAAGATWVAPRPPDVVSHFGVQDLRAE
jgi:ABC-type amino acid transport substrate-binding protein